MLLRGACVCNQFLFIAYMTNLYILFLSCKAIQRPPFSRLFPKERKKRKERRKRERKKRKEKEKRRKERKLEEQRKDKGNVHSHG